MPVIKRALVVTSGRDRGSLAAVRALDRAGWFVGVGTPDGTGMVSASRGCSRRHAVPRPRGDAACFVDAVRRAVAEGGYDIVFGGGDDWMAALATYRDGIPVAVAHPPADVVHAALDKVGLAHRATAAGIRAPRTQLATPAALTAWRGPVVVKCRAHWRPNQGHELRIEARRYPDVSNSVDRVRLLTDAGFEPVLQEPIDGTLEALIGIVHDGRLLGRVHQQALALWPTPSGVTCRARTIPVDDNLAARATRLLADLGWSGLVQLQFLRNSDDVPYLIDLNGRFFGSMALANAAGPNLADAWGRQVLGEPMPALGDARPSVRFLWTAGDLRRACVERRGSTRRHQLHAALVPGCCHERVEPPGSRTHAHVDQ
ncbi:ATP-grasp domain-containing protein [Blastococcus brunescens]|uniref:ATP-grasp domain-containing protein n=1 Tax=Blastococcus brunescens TaxID=1564165 RepID=A0ABZ1B513_9ACTN|nr:ATP-grasp domain-containing protein [Blastococcus sp. BMG 8361]WRL65892.1 ATP-grasp domain-containing protein [Blastococcus sp. BMG 8361]